MYQEHTFKFPELKGISQKQLDVHLKLYGGYVKNVNLLLATVAAYQNTNDEGGAFAVAEMRRRLGFEFDGMRTHEYYFSQWESGSNSDAPILQKALADQYESFEKWLGYFKTVGMTRGIGWTILYFDGAVKKFHNAWVADHELGQLAGLPIILAMDMWEHAFMVDYAPADKKKYIEAFFDNLNWGVMEERFSKVKK